MQCAIQECYNLCACAGGIGAEGICACAAGNAVFCRPKHCIMVIIRCIHIHKRIFCRNHRGLLAAPQEGNNLSTGARSVGGEGCSGCTACNAVFDCPQYRITIVGIRRYICEGHLCAAWCRTACRSPQEGYRLRACAGSIGREGCGGGAAGSAILHCPLNCIIVVAVCRHVLEGVWYFIFGLIHDECGFNGTLEEGIVKVYLPSFSVSVSF